MQLQGRSEVPREPLLKDELVRAASGASSM